MLRYKQCFYNFIVLLLHDVLVYFCQEQPCQGTASCDHLLAMQKSSQPNLAPSKSTGSNAKGQANVINSTASSLHNNSRHNDSGKQQSTRNPKPTNENVSQNQQDSKDCASHSSSNNLLNNNNNSSASSNHSTGGNRS